MSLNIDLGSLLSCLPMHTNASQTVQVYANQGKLCKIFCKYSGTFEEVKKLVVPFIVTCLFLVSGAEVIPRVANRV